MQLHLAEALVHLKVVVFGPNAAALLEECLAAGVGGQVLRHELDGQQVFVMEPRVLPSLTPRFHFVLDARATVDAGARAQLFEAADAVVLVEPDDAQLEAARLAAETAGLRWDGLTKVAFGGTTPLPTVTAPGKVVDAVGARVCAAVADGLPPGLGPGAEELRRWVSFARKLPWASAPGDGPLVSSQPLGDRPLGWQVVVPIVVGFAAFVLFALARVACQ